MGFKELLDQGAEPRRIVEHSQTGSVGARDVQLDAGYKRRDLPMAFNDFVFDGAGDADEGACAASAQTRKSRFYAIQAFAGETRAS